MIARMFGNFFQHAYVTDDIARAKQTFADRWGVRSYFEFQPTLELRTRFGIQPAEVKIAMAFVDELQIELIEPVSGPGADIYRDGLPAGRFATVFHHCGFRIVGPASAWDEWRASVGNDSYPVAIEGDLGFLKFVYLDTRQSLGHYCEYVWSSRDLDAPVPRH